MSLLDAVKPFVYDATDQRVKKHLRRLDKSVVADLDCNPNGMMGSKY